MSAGEFLSLDKRKKQDLSSIANYRATKHLTKAKPAKVQATQTSGWALTYSLKGSKTNIVKYSLFDTEHSTSIAYATFSMS